jgi:hypothetical protein
LSFAGLYYLFFLIIQVKEDFDFKGRPLCHVYCEQIWNYKASGSLVFFGISMLLHSFALWYNGITKFLAIGKLFMNNSGNFMDEFEVLIVGRYIDGNCYTVFDVEDILYNVGLINYKDNNEGIHKVTVSGHMLYLAKSLTKEHLAN